MKNLMKCLTAMSVCFASCQQGNLVNPDDSSLPSSHNMREAAMPTTPKFYQLVKHGGSTLTYSPDGLLEKVTFENESRSNFPTYKVYTYNANSIVSKKYSNNKLEEVITYLLDPNTGNCYESQHKAYSVSGQIQTKAKESTYAYFYNIKGQLMMRENKHNPKDYTLLNYDTVWNLINVTTYGDAGNGAAKVVAESNLSYNQPTGDPLLLNLLPINCEVANLPDAYLRIFGKPTKYLVKMITEKGALGGRYFSYSMNADGYPTARQMYNLSGGDLTQTVNYDYLVTNIGLSL
ncbi:hypothetical protein [Dyadobacter luticola]|uniref:DUF4595 domain-containing protein n=1 Tax=Dyadobacter luticola TaxID=1979387 RepID=A0A5R9L1B9_9BACT|nr:hypothetical protein [Dyadobacter luticola]TLV02208.1 hypothetical protein FEN17_00780 [Dyadobacter luticola]